MLTSDSLRSFEQLYEKWRCAEEAACHAEDEAWTKYRACCQGHGSAPSNEEMALAARLRSEASQRLMAAMAQVWSQPL